MVMLGGGNYVKATDVQNGDRVTFMDEGEWIESQYKKEDGSPRMQFVMTVKCKGEDKKMRINKTNSDTLVDAYGPETQEWIGKQAIITVEKVLVAGKKMDTILLSVDAADQPESVDVDQEPESEIPF